MFTLIFLELIKYFLMSIKKVKLYYTGSHRVRNNIIGLN